MPHPTIGLPPADASAGQPAAAASLRRERGRLPRLALEATVRLAPDFRTRYDDRMLRLFLRDYERHIEQLARALETAEDYWVVNYGEWLVPVMRRREVPMKDFAMLLVGLRAAAVTVLSPTEAAATRELIDRWLARLKFHGRLAGDHQGNRIVRFFWKGAGIADDSVI
ncbi:MAG: hypothetical protein H0V12_02660 [Chloroflexi bacterium]|nr:hypothetical protein [Chloroflexota bacterium]